MTSNGSNKDHFINKKEELSKIEINTNDVVKWLLMHGCDYVKLAQASRPRPSRPKRSTGSPPSWTPRASTRRRR